MTDHLPFFQGCNSTATSTGGPCSQRFAEDWAGVYQTDYTPAIKNLVWYSSLGNHDVLGKVKRFNPGYYFRFGF
jgi:hypothetical protein